MFAGRRAALPLIAVALVAGALPAAARAHATLLRTEPADAASLTKAPRQVRLWFSEEVARSAGVVRLRDAGGNLVPGTKLDLSGARSGRVAVALPRLEPGVYSLDWRLLSEDDSHLSKGAIAFGVATRVGAIADRDANGAVAGADVFLRWLGLLSLAGIVGALAVAVCVFGPVAGAARDAPVAAAAECARGRALGCAAVCAAGSATVGISVLLWHTSSLTTESAGAWKVAWRLLSESRWGSLWIAREILALALLGALLLLPRDGRRPAATSVRRPLVLSATVTLALALVAVQALSGHAFDLTPNRAFAVFVAAVHLLAALIWIGAALAAVVSLWPLLGRRRQQSAALARTCIAPFSVLAAACVGLLAATGLYYAGRQVASLDALLTTLYGQTLLGKLGLVLGVGALGLLNALILRPAPLSRLLRRPDGWTPLSPTRLRPLLVAEATLGVGLLMVVGLLTALPPARGPAFAQVPASTPSFLSGSVDDLLVSVSVRPNRPGPNMFEVGAVSTRRPAPAPIERVRLRFTGRQGSVTSPPLTEIEPGRYRSSGRYLYESGAWRIETLVARAGLGERVARFDWAVASSGAPRHVLVSRRPLEPILTSAAAVLFLGLVIASAWWLARGRRVAVEPPIRQGLEEGAK